MSNAMQTNAETKLANSRKFIMRHQAFFATVMLGLNMQQNDQVETMATDGKNLLWCADFIANECNQAKTSFIILHEILHVVFKHHLRRGKRNLRLWNNAADYVINAKIVHMGLKHTWSVEDFRQADRHWLLTHGLFSREDYRMPEDGLFKAKYFGMSTEDVYDILKKEADAAPDKGDKGDNESQTGSDQGQGE